jgi:hypothetical protein
MADIPFDVVIAHGPCNDGRTAAWVYWSTLPDSVKAELAKLGGVYAPRDAEETGGGPKMRPSVTSLEGAAALVAGPDTARKVLGVEIARAPPVVFAFAAPQSPVPDALVRGRRVLALDLDLGDELRAVVAAAAFVHLIDHHASAEPHIRAVRRDFPPERFTYSFDVGKMFSGALLAWIQFRSLDAVPELVRAVQIADTWSWDQDPAIDMRAVVLAMAVRRVLRSFPDISATVDAWQSFPDGPRAFTAFLADEGRAFMRYRDHVVSGIAARPSVFYVVVKVGEERRWLRALGVNGSVFSSEVGHALRAETAPAFEAKGVRIDFTFQWYWRPDDGIVVASLRGPGSGIDLSRVAAAIVGDGKERGGGHPAAAGLAIRGLENFGKVFLTAPPDGVAEFQPTEP